jgi:hypothetical protein
MRKPDLLILVAVWNFILAFFMLIGIFAVAFIGLPAALMDTVGIDRTAVIFGISVGIIVMLALLIIALAAGIGLLQGKNWGRVMSIVIAAAGLLGFPLGTVIGVLIIIYLGRQDVKDYFLPRAV